MDRREFVALIAASGLSGLLRPVVGLAATPDFIAKPIPSTGEALPLVGLGTWITFNVGRDPVALDSSAQVVRAFFDAGGRMIDSSPMYGSSQPTIGNALRQLGDSSSLFATEKVWTSSGVKGPGQIEQSRKYWGVPHFDLLQVHNLRAWEDHLPTLLAMKAEGRLRYVGITTSHGRRHSDLVRIIENQPIDFIQATYNMADRQVERRVLPAARANGIAVICNRPYGGGRLIRRAKRRAFPDWAMNAGMANWAEFLLKFVVSHPAVNCAIPATTRVDHVRENMGASRGILPDTALRTQMAKYFEGL